MLPPQGAGSDEVVGSNPAAPTNKTIPSYRLQSCKVGKPCNDLSGSLREYSLRGSAAGGGVGEQRTK